MLFGHKHSAENTTELMLRERPVIDVMTWETGVGILPNGDG